MRYAVLAACGIKNAGGTGLEGPARLYIKPNWNVALHLGENGPDIGVLAIPLSAAQLVQLSERRRMRLWRRCKKELIRAGVACLYIADDLMGFEGLGEQMGGLEMPDGHALMRQMAREILHQAARQRGAELFSAEIGVWQPSCDEAGYQVLLSIADSLKYVTLFTKEPASAAPFAERLFSQTGLSANIAQANAMMRCDFVLLLGKYAGPNVGDRTVLIDLSGSMAAGCLNTACFTLSPRLAVLSPFLGQADQRAMEFLVRAHGGKLQDGPGLLKQIRQLGCGLQNICYKPPKILDNADGLVYNKP